MVWKQREQYMKEQMFQMMVMMNAGAVNKNPEAMMQQYYLLQNQMAQNFSNKQGDPNQYGQSIQNYSIPKPKSQFQQKQMFQVQTQFHNLPKIISNIPVGQNHQFPSENQLTDRTQFTIPQNTTFVPIEGSVNSSGMNIHAKLDPQQFQKSLSSDTKLLNINSTQAKLKNKAKEIHQSHQNFQAKKSWSNAFLAETWVPQDDPVKRQMMEQLDKIKQNQSQIKQQQDGESQGSYNTFNQNIKDINKQLNELNGKAETVRQYIRDSKQDQVIKEQSERSIKMQNSWDDRDDIDGEDDDNNNKNQDDQHVIANSTTFKIKGTGEYSPMSTGKRQTFYDQLNQIQFDGGSQALAKLKSSLQKENQENFQQVDASIGDKFDAQQSQKLQQYMKSVERRVEAELEIQQRKQGFKVYSNQELKEIQQKKTKQAKLKNLNKDDMIERLQKNEKKFTSGQKYLNGTRKSWASKKKIQKIESPLKTKMQQPPTQTLEKIMSDIQQGYQNDDEINIACTQQNTLPQSTLNLMVNNIQYDCKALEKANKKFQSAGRLHTAQKEYWMSNQGDIPQEDIALLRPPTSNWEEQASAYRRQESKKFDQTQSSCRPLQSQKIQGIEQIELSNPSIKQSVLRFDKDFNEQRDNGVNDDDDDDDDDDINDIKPPQKFKRVNHTPERLGTCTSSQYNLAAGESTLQQINENIISSKEQQHTTRNNEIAAQTLYDEKNKFINPTEADEICANTYTKGFKKFEQSDVKKMKLTSLSDLRGQVKKSKMRDSQIVVSQFIHLFILSKQNGLEQHIKQLQDQVQSSKGFEKYKKQLNTQQFQQPLLEEKNLAIGQEGGGYDESGELKFNSKIDQMISEFEPPSHLTEKSNS